MGKEIRFSVLVKASGKPETLTLWENPKNNPVVIKAVKQNRILTIIQHPGGKGKDFGQIGFHQQPGALYLVFPKKLKADVNMRVVGLKYDLIAETAAKGSTTPAKAATKEKSQPVKTKPPVETPPPPPPPPKPPVEKRFEVTIRRVAVKETQTIVTAKNKAEAEARALSEMAGEDFKVSPEEVQDKILSSKETAKPSI